MPSHPLHRHELISIQDRQNIQNFCPSHICTLYPITPTIPPQHLHGHTTHLVIMSHSHCPAPAQVTYVRGNMLRVNGTPVRPSGVRVATATGWHGLRSSPNTPASCITMETFPWSWFNELCWSPIVSIKWGEIIPVQSNMADVGQYIRHG